MYEVNGKIKVVFDTQTFPSGFAKREFVVTTAHDKFPQDLKFEVVKDKCEKLDAFRPGQPVKVSFDVRGNEYNGKFYVSLSAWKVTSEGEPVSQEPTRRQSTPGQPATNSGDDFDSEIPF